ncbi:unnamed protein product [Blepharisma stoltei]|uniref:Cyclic nucleotide-binding domain-containing protein n=1 Tax=Blepharisma stoltei TaxID=1481888 RepID=A0AAU9K2Y6_9CILI|nr:unnamed protein product [Blepharisma stoltei]
MGEPQTETATSKENQFLISDLKAILEKAPESRTDDDISKIMSFTENVKFFKSLTDESSNIIHKECCIYMTYEFFSTDEYVFHQGERGNKFYVLLFGSIGVQIPIMNQETQEIQLQEVLILRDGASFGELALLEKKPRAASIQCKEPSHFAVLDKPNYQRILSKLMNDKKQDIVNYLQNLPIFQKWTKGSLTKLSFFFEEKYFYRKHIMYKEGDEAKEVYLIKEGEFQFIKKIPIDHDFSNQKKLTKVLVPKKSISHRAEVAILGKGEFFGEEEVINETKRTTTCICYSQQAIVLAISASDFVKRITSEDSWKIIKHKNDIKNGYRSKQIQSITEEVTQFANSPKKIEEKISESPAKEEVPSLSLGANFTRIYDHVRNSYLFKTTERELIQRQRTLSPIKSEPKDLKINLQKTENFARPESSLSNTYRALSSQRNRSNTDFSSFNLERKSVSRIKRRDTISPQDQDFSDTFQYEAVTDVTFHKLVPPPSPIKNQSPPSRMKLRRRIAENSVSVFSINSFPVYSTLWDAPKVHCNRRISRNIHVANRVRPIHRTLSHIWR